VCITIVLKSIAADSVTDGSVVKKVIDLKSGGENLLKPNAFHAYEKGFDNQDGIWTCDNGVNAKAARGIEQTVFLNQTSPQPIIASAWAKSEDVSGDADSDYSIYLDFVFADGTPLYGQSASFNTGTQDWQRREVFVLPEKPVKSVSFYLLFRKHAGKAFFRDAQLRQPKASENASLFDGVFVQPVPPAAEGFQVRDVALGSDFIGLKHEAQGLKLDSNRREERGATFIDATLRDTTNKDRAITLLYALPVEGDGWRWQADPRHSENCAPMREYISASRTGVGANGRLSRYPFATIVNEKRGLAIGIDMSFPAHFRACFNNATHELFLAWDLGLTPEKAEAKVRFCYFSFEGQSGFRAALAKYYELFPEQFRCRIPRQGLWMPFAKISAVKEWEDFGFRFKEGTDETAWDDAHDILTFRYTEPMTWWMAMPKGMPRTLDAALAEATRLANDKNDLGAKAFLTSGYHDLNGHFSAKLLDTPWCDGAVWSVNSMPGIDGEVSDFKNKWSAALRESLYGPKKKADLDGEYIDSSEGYVTEPLNFRRDHFAAADTPLTFSMDSRQPGIYRGLIAFEYIRALARDVHAIGKFSMANGTPSQLCFLAPLLDVLGTETDWNHNGKWTPMSDAELLYRRALCKGKPYCFLMNTPFEKLSHELVDKYMQRALAYGMFPGFFSEDAANKQYFTRPELYNRDRDLFKKYVPLCKRIAEAGWDPLTRAKSNDAKVYVERFGNKFLTVFNDSTETRTVTLTLDSPVPTAAFELLRGAPIEIKGGAAVLELEGESVRVMELK
jgi:hypothetical protein